MDRHETNACEFVSLGPGGVVRSHTAPRGHAGYGHGLTGRVATGMRRLALAILALAACGRSPDAGRSLATHDCEAAGVRAQCTTLTVPEERDDPDSREIELAIAIVPTFESPSLEPIVLLSGGPGQGAIEAFGPLLPRFNEHRSHHNIVLLDQPGTGRSHPLSCGELDDLDLEQQLSTDVDSERLTRCLDGLDADPRLYTTTHAIAHLVAALDGLGYASANLVGGSYGTR